MKKKIIRLITSLALLLLQVVPVMANTTSTAVSGNDGAGIQDCIVSFSSEGDNAPAYTISLPAKINLKLKKNNATGKYKFMSSFLYGATGNIGGNDTIDFFPGTLGDCDPSANGDLIASCKYNIVNTTDSSQEITAYVNTRDMYKGAVLLDNEGEVKPDSWDDSVAERANTLTKGVIRHSIDSKNAYPLDVLNNAADLESYFGNTTGFHVYDDLNTSDRDRSPFWIGADEIQDTIDIAEKDGDFDGYDPFFYRIGDIESDEIDPMALKSGTYKADVTFTFGLNLESNYRAAHI